jgi:putative glycosyltransferase (TIGR04372 family)
MKDRAMKSLNPTFIFSKRENLIKRLELEFSKLDLKGAILDLREYISDFPTEKDILPRLYATTLNTVGSTSAAKSIAKLYIEANDKTREFAKNQLNLEPIVNTIWMLTRIGEMAEQTGSVNHLLALKQIKKKPILPILDPNMLCNIGFLPYLEDSFHVLKPGEEAKYYSQYANISSFNTTFINYSRDVYGHYSDTAPGVHKILKNKNLSHFAFKLKEITKKGAQTFLKKHGLNLEDDFVTLHLRESGYFDGEQHAWRNINLDDHLEAIKHLTEQGIKVVRIGHKKMKQAPDIPGLIDLSGFDRPPEVDIFLSAACLFFYGSPSGPCSLAYQFGRPMLLVSVFPYAHARPNSLNQLVPLVEIGSSKTLSLKELYERDLSNIFSPIPYKRMGIEICKISAVENINAVKEMLIKHNSLNQDVSADTMSGIGLPDNIWITDNSKLLL